MTNLFETTQCIEVNPKEYKVMVDAMTVLANSPMEASAAYIADMLSLSRKVNDAGTRMLNALIDAQPNGREG